MQMKIVSNNHKQVMMSTGKKRAVKHYIETLDDFFPRNGFRMETNNNRPNGFNKEKKKMKYQRTENQDDGGKSTHAHLDPTNSHGYGRN